MEAIATLSLVCNVMQVITFSGDLLALCRRTFKDGTPEPGLQDSTARLHDLVLSLSTGINDFDAIRTYQNTNPLLQQQETGRLQGLASELLQDTEKLQQLLHKATDTSTKRRAVGTAIKYKLRYKGEVSSLEKKIQHYHRILNSEFLTRICSSNQAIVAKSEESFSNLSQEIKAFIDRWSDGDRDMSRLISAEAREIKSHITAKSNIVVNQMRTDSEANMVHRNAEHRKTRDLVASEASRIKEHLDSSRQVDASRREMEEMKKRILSTLWFPEMNQRENDIVEASEDTVKWILGEEISDSETESQASTIDSEDEDLQSPDGETLFQQMWKRQDADWPRYKEESAKVLWFALYTSRMFSRAMVTTSILFYILGTHEAHRSDILRLSDMKTDLLIVDQNRLAHEYENWLSARSVGLLEVDRSSSTSSDRPSRLFDKVRFVHRSATEFLLHTIDGHAILTCDQSSAKTRTSRIADALKMLCFIVPDKIRLTAPFPVPVALYPIFLYTQLVRDWAIAGGISVAEELDLLSNFKSLLQSRYGTRFPDVEFFKAAAWCGIDLEDQLTGGSGQTPHIMFGRERWIDVIKWLLRAGANPNVRCYVNVAPFVDDIPPPARTIFTTFLAEAAHLLRATHWEMTDMTMNEKEQTSSIILDGVREFSAHGGDWDQQVLYFLQELDPQQFYSGPALIDEGYSDCRAFFVVN
ncbi:hypothetical protein DL770_011584 [Monosporascus sp. CRB-9-2]|nr:hypothetical protein DL770_011584 [Monosporascus sp. CRB-9-2]